MTTPKIAIIIGSTRDARFGEKPAKWLLERAQKRDDFDVELVDLKDFDLPLFNEKASNMWVPSEDPAAIAWQEKIAEFDGYIFVTAEYNHSVTGALKNALDQAYTQWVRKPMGALGYGGVGAARAVEHLRGIGVELQMVPVRNAVHIAAGSFMKVHPMGENAEISEIEDAIGGSADALFDDMAWWANATKAAREA
ncbi:MAG: NAD(P)H-dependent oxidoreductase [Vannielia sp.]|uniref:NADPH-dependent FMN reductase n=1 Tax=Rhodobacterales TaxID=204455 RepID=UPI0020956F7D|nr:NAD(P)H-dependent oxidoreductase [Oceanicola sp. 502str15]MCO6382554.1 FMN reductase [Oceanicola sp. 502str15]